MDTGFAFSASEEKRFYKLFQTVFKFEKSKKGTASLEELAQLSIAILLDEIEKNKEDAFLWSLLGDYYNNAIKENGMALNAYKKAYELEPNNPRTVFNLASCYNTLSKARIIGHPKYGVLAKEPSRFLDPNNSKKWLQELGMSEEESADKAWSLFYQVLDMGINRKEREHVLETAATLKNLYPYLEVPKSYKSTPSNLSVGIAAALLFLFFLALILFLAGGIPV